MRATNAADALCELPDPDSRAYEAQKLVLLDLVVDPPATGDHFDVVCELLELPRKEIEAAVALCCVGLAQRSGDVVFASDAASYFEYLWPTGLVNALAIEVERHDRGTLVAAGVRLRWATPNPSPDMVSHVFVLDRPIQTQPPGATGDAARTHHPPQPT
jgi:hypothetical protein